MEGHRLTAYSLRDCVSVSVRFARMAKTMNNVMCAFLQFVVVVAFGLSSWFVGCAHTDFSYFSPLSWCVFVFYFSSVHFGDWMTESSRVARKIG